MTDEAMTDTKRARAAWRPEQPAPDSPAMLIGYSSFEWTSDPVIRAEDGAAVKITQAVFRF